VGTAPHEAPFALDARAPLTTVATFDIVPGAVTRRMKEQAWDDSTTRWR